MAGNGIGTQIRPGWGCPFSKNSQKLTFWPKSALAGGVHFQKNPKNLHVGPNPPRLKVSIFKKFTKIDMLAFLGSKMVKKKLRLKGRDPPSDLCVENLRTVALVVSKTVGWGPNW